MTERVVLGQAQRILVDATSNIWHKISLWTHASDVEMPSGDPLNTYLVDMNDDLQGQIDGKYNSYNIETVEISGFSQIPEVGYSRIHTTGSLATAKYVIPADHYCYCYSGKDPNGVEKMAVMIDTTDLSSLVMYIAHYNIEAKWTLTKISTQDQIDDLQNQINELSSAFNQLDLFVNQAVGDITNQYQILQDQMDWLEAELAELQEQLNDLLNELRDFKRTITARVDNLEKEFNKKINEIWDYLNKCCDEVKGRLDELENNQDDMEECCDDVQSRLADLERKMNELSNKPDAESIFQQLYGRVGSIFITHVSGFNPGSVFGGTWQLIDNAYLYAGTSVQPYGNYLGSNSVTLSENNLPEHRHLFGTGDGNYYHDGMWDVKDGYGIDIQVSDAIWNLAGSTNMHLELLYNDRVRVLGGNKLRQAASGTAFAGGGQPFNVEPYHFNVFCWLRTA